MPENTIKKVIPNPQFGVLEDEFDAYIADQKKVEAKEKIINIKKAVHLDEDDGWEDENFYEDEFGKHRASHLWAAAKGLPVKKVVITDLFDPKKWLAMKKRPDATGPEYYQKELARIERADLSYPIILTPSGKICDGFHRAMKAYLAGEKTIDAIQLEKMTGDKTSKKANLDITKIKGMFDVLINKIAQDKPKEEELTHPIEDIEAAALNESYGPHRQEPDIKKLKEELEKNPDVELDSIEEYVSPDESDFEDE
jgi:hypothetical protein